MENLSDISRFGLGVVYQQRGSQFGNMAGIELGFDLPVFASTRQDPLIAARVAERAALDADYQAQLRAHNAELDADLAEYRRLDRALARQNEVLLPLAQEKVALTLAAWRGGQGSLAELVGARRARIDAELKAIELAGARDEMAARLHFTYAQPDESARPSRDWRAIRSTCATRANGATPRKSSPRCPSSPPAAARSPSAWWPRSGSARARRC